MLTLRNEETDHPGYGSVDLEEAAPGDAFFVAGFPNVTSTGLFPTYVRRYVVQRAGKRDILATDRNGREARFSRKAFVPNASLDKAGMQWALDSIRLVNRVRDGWTAIDRVLKNNSERGLLDAELADALDQWRARHGLSPDGTPEEGKTEQPPRGPGQA